MQRIDARLLILARGFSSKTHADIDRQIEEFGFCVGLHNLPIPAKAILVENFDRLAGLLPGLHSAILRDWLNGLNALESGDKEGITRRKVEVIRRQGSEKIGAALLGWRRYLAGEPFHPDDEEILAVCGHTVQAANVAVIEPEKNHIQDAQQRPIAGPDDLYDQDAAAARKRAFEVIKSVYPCMSVRNRQADIDCQMIEGFLAVAWQEHGQDGLDFVCELAEMKARSVVLKNPMSAVIAELKKRYPRTLAG